VIRGRKMIERKVDGKRLCEVSFALGMFKGYVINQRGVGNQERELIEMSLVGK
jgi:hypothetical protein